MKTKDWKYFERIEGGYVIAHIVGETEAGKAAGIAWYRNLYKFHEASFPYDETGLTCNIRRRPNDGG
jgi:hypothetical protein